ncbi:hypothetical protein ACHAXA_004598 [Cyclostephanos tholiformis]|uniref:Uncharacterized protein n=1 Tax=Cyclostephanos tholiformis TaxID=382380 RepID=A0ABD3SNW2_9STRA
MLKSKPSRLTKKMKHARLSTNLYRLRSGRLSRDDSISLSNLERDFVNAISDPIERSEVIFHMQREWREHLAERLTYLGLDYESSGWLRSIDAVDRRVATEVTRSRMVKRRCLMGRAMEMDAGESAPGVYIDDDKSALGGEFVVNNQGGGGSGGEGRAAGGDFETFDINAVEDDGEFEGFLMSMLEDRPASTPPTHEGVYQHVGSPNHHPAPNYPDPRSHYSLSRDSNFRRAAPFLAGVTSYMERHGLPFEHVDVWVPSSVPPSSLARECNAPLITSLGSGSFANLTDMAGEGVTEAAKGGRKLVGRLCFGGSATLGTQIIDVSPSSASIDEMKDGGGGRKRHLPGPERTIVPLTDDEAFKFSLFGDYSEMFSFSSGCGLPGRVFQSGVATWEQYLANAPPEMFERRGGAIQFGIRTALGLPIESPNAGRIVLVMYSRHNRDKDEGLVLRMVRDIRLMNPCPRWKMMVEIKPPGAGGNVPPMPVGTKPPSIHHLQLMVTGEAGKNYPASTSAPDYDRNKRINNLMVLLHENMPTDLSSPLGAHLNSMMSLRMLLLGCARTEREEELVETMLVLHESYTGRPSQDVTFLLMRDYEFHTQHQHIMAMANGSRIVAPANLQGPPQPLMMSNFNPTPMST